MDKRTIILIIVFFALIVIGMVSFSYLKRTEQKNIQSPEATLTLKYDANPLVLS